MQYCKQSIIYVRTDALVHASGENLTITGSTTIVGLKPSVTGTPISPIKIVAGFHSHMGLECLHIHQYLNMGKQNRSNPLIISFHHSKVGLNSKAKGLKYLRVVIRQLKVKFMERKFGPSFKMYAAPQI